MSGLSEQSLIECQRIIHGFRDKKIMVVGDLMVDEYVWGEVSRVSQEAPVPIVLIKERSFRLGGACNVANNIASLGAMASPVGLVGDDYRAGLLRDMLSERGIPVEGLIHDQNRATTTKTRVMARGQQIVRYDEESTEEPGEEARAFMLSFIRERMPNIDALIIEDYGKGVICPEFIRELLTIARDSGKIVTVDPKDEHFLLYKNVTVMTPNVHEVATFWGRKIKTFDELHAAGKKLLDETHSEAILVTRGEHGMLLISREAEPFSIPTVAREVYDVTGAGDTVIAVLTVALCAGASMERAAQLANYAAGSVVTEIGAATVTADELLASLADSLEQQKGNS
ncbi:MAG: D-glycero-beta-D-manno-heptose-7-phosphate kinase [Candidatus Coatesbacteria bacterium]|nr:D-glycero-beta-D-manno-heptose-7-phosphate kinase [Candidatus Coatesbacteria bacterium]